MAEAHWAQAVSCELQLRDIFAKCTTTLSTHLQACNSWNSRPKFQILHACRWVDNVVLRSYCTAVFGLCVVGLHWLPLHEEHMFDVLIVLFHVTSRHQTCTQASNWRPAIVFSTKHAACHCGVLLNIFSRDSLYCRGVYLAYFINRLLTRVCWCITELKHQQLQHILQQPYFK